MSIEISSAMITKAKKLLPMVQKKRETMEYGTVTIKKVKNLSRSDVDDLHFILTGILNGNTAFLSGFLSSGVKQVLINTEILEA